MNIVAPWLTSPAAHAVFDAIEAAGFEVRAVGGAIRNTIAEIAVADVDLATTATPDDVIAAVTRAGLQAIPTGRDHGTVTVLSRGASFEVTTLRRDVSTDGRRAVVAFTDDWETDAHRRDFTINALYADRDGHVFDFVGGVADLLAARVRFIGDADTRIREDYLRVLRFFRFSSAFGRGQLDQGGFAACQQNAAGLATLSGERVATELLRLVETPAAAQMCDALLDAGLLAPVLPTITLFPPLGSVGRLIALERQFEAPPSAVRRLATWLAADAVRAETVARRLRLSRALTEALIAMTNPDNRRRIQRMETETAARAVLYDMGRQTAIDALLLSAAADANPSNSATTPQRYMWLATLDVPALPASGSDLVARGVSAGPEIGVKLRAFERWWIAADFPTDRVVIAHALDTIAADADDKAPAPKG